MNLDNFVLKWGLWKTKMMMLQKTPEFEPELEYTKTKNIKTKTDYVFDNRGIDIFKNQFCSRPTLWVDLNCALLRLVKRVKRPKNSKHRQCTLFKFWSHKVKIKILSLEDWVPLFLSSFSVCWTREQSTMKFHFYLIFNRRWNEK